MFVLGENVQMSECMIGVGECMVVKTETGMCKVRI